MRTDWPLGPALQAARLRAGISARAAAKRAGISSGRWYQLETGVQKSKGHEIPIGTTASTVAAVARAVNWDIREALKVAGFDERDYSPSTPLTPAQALSNDELLAEIRRRLIGVRNDLEVAPQSDASREAGQAQEALVDDPQRRPISDLLATPEDPGVDGAKDGEQGEDFG